MPDTKISALSAVASVAAGNEFAVNENFRWSTYRRLARQLGGILSSIAAVFR